jgi:general nucleoside transport system permease protein
MAGFSVEKRPAVSGGVMSLAVEFASILSATAKAAIPLILAALGGMFAERSGTADIALEGKMLGSAFAGAAVAALTSSIMCGIAAAILTGVGMALIQGFAAITCRGDQVIAGVAVNFIAAGLTSTIGLALFGMGGRTPPLSLTERFMPIHLPVGAEFGQIPVIGPLYTIFLADQDIFFYVTLLAVPLVAAVLRYTDFGLALRGAGEHPEAVDSAGRSVASVRYLALAIDGFLCALSGLVISMGRMSSFIPNMTAGQGFLALTALIFGRWRPASVMSVCFLFGFLATLEDRLQGNSLPLVGQLPTQLIQALPYILTLVLLAAMKSGVVAPTALGRPFVRQT